MPQAQIKQDGSLHADLNTGKWTFELSLVTVSENNSVKFFIKKILLIFKITFKNKWKN